MTVQFSLGSNAPESTTTPVAVVGVYENGVLTSAAARIDTAGGGAIKRLVEAGDITGKVGNLVTLLHPAGVAAARVLVVGLGAQKTFDAARYQRVTLEAARAVGRLPVTEAVSWLPEVEVPGRDAAWRLRVAALATDHAAYRYTATVKPRDKALPELATMTLVGPADGEAGLAEARAIAEGVRYAKELGNLPPNICNPDYIADQAKAFADSHEGVTFRPSTAPTWSVKASARCWPWPVGRPTRRAWSSFSGTAARTANVPTPSSARASPSIPAASA